MAATRFVELDDPSWEPYEEGQLLPLRFTLKDGTFRVEYCRVIKSFKPYTLSCVLLVQIPGFTIGSPEAWAHAILKLYDRRFSTQLRSDENVDPWMVATEEEFVEFVTSGNMHIFLKDWQDGKNLEPPGEGSSLAEKEAYIYTRCKEYFFDEVTAYDHMRDLQGNQIPKLYATVCLDLTSGERKDDYLTISGLLLEYIPGPTLTQMTDCIPRNHWQSIVDKAVKIVRDYAPLGILNHDVRSSNFVIKQEGPNDDSYRVVMIDFALCDFHEAGVTDEEWAREKLKMDEEGAVGAVMKIRLEKLGFDLVYVPSFRWAEYAVDEVDE